MKARLNYSLGAEVAMTRLVRRMGRAATAAAEAELRNSWPEIDRPAIAAAIRRAAFSGPHMAELLRIAAAVQSGMRRQLRALGVRAPAGGQNDQLMAKAWAIEVERTLRALFVGGATDSARTDGIRLILQSVVSVAQEEREEAEEEEAEAEPGRERSLVATLAAALATVIVAVQAAAAHAVEVTEGVARAATVSFGAQMNEEIQISGGVGEYIWTTQRDDRVRDRHRDLDGSVQEWANPPIIDEEGTRGNPGDAHRCRCLAVPVIPQATSRDPRIAEPYTPEVFAGGNTLARRSPSFALTSRPDDPLRNLNVPRPEERFVTRLRERQRRWLGLDK